MTHTLFVNRIGSSWLSITGVFCTCLYAYLSIYSHAGVSFWQLLISLTLAALAVFAYWYHAKINNIQPSIWQVLFWALIFRLLGVFGAPILEDDYYRFLWDGFVFVEQGSPYGIAPDAFFGSENISDKFDSILSGINHPQIATIYGPALQWLFGIGYLLAPGEVWFLQLAFAAFDMGIVLLLLKVAPSRNVLLYAWCPLLIKEFAFTAHTDVMAVFFVVAACILMQRQHWKTMGVVLALAVASKVFALILAPLLLVRNARSWVPFGLALLLIYLPFYDSLFSEDHGLTAMSAGWIFNAPAYYLLPNYEWTIKAVFGGAFALFYLLYICRWRKHRGTELPRGDWIYGVFLLILPVANAWYVVWVLPFAVIRPSFAPWAASIALVLSYAVGLNLNDTSLTGYQQPAWAIAIEYVAIYTAVAVDIAWAKRNKSVTATAEY